MSLFLRTAVVAGLIALLSGPGLSLAEIRIGIVGPLSGPVAQYGDMQFSGARMAIEQINAAGGIDGKPLVAIEADDACDPRKAVTAANEMVSQGVRFVVGHLCSSSTQPASDIYEARGILMITPASTNPEITRRGYKLVFRTIGLDSMQGAVAARYLASLSPDKVAIIHDQQQYGEGIAREVRTTLQSAGVDVPLFEGVAAGARDFSALISRMQQAGISHVYYGGYHPELALILRQSREAGFNAVFMGPEGVGNRDLNHTAGEAAEGLLLTLPPSFDERPRNQDLVKAFAENNRDTSGPFVLPAFTAVQLIAEGVRRAGSEDPIAVAQALRSGEFDTPLGILRFQENGDLTSFDFEVFRWHADGTRTPVNQASNR